MQPQNTRNGEERGNPISSLSSFFFSLLNEIKWIRIIGFFFIFIFFFVPVIRLVYISFQADTGVTLAHYASVLSERATWNTIKNTVYMVTGSTILSVSLGTIVAWFVAYTNIQAKKMMQLFIFLPFVIPSYIITLAWTHFVGSNGLLTKVLGLFSIAHFSPDLYNMWGIIFIMGLSHYPIVYLFTVSVFRKIPRELEHAARVSGVPKGLTFIKITLPLALPGIASGGLLAFIASLDNFGIPAFLGIPAHVRVLSTHIYEQIVGFGPTAFARGAVLSVVLGVIALLGTGVQWLLLRRTKQLETSREDTEPRVQLPQGLRRIIESLIWFFLLTSSLVPLISMMSTSFIRAYGLDLKLENMTLKHYTFILLSNSDTKMAIINSLTLAVSTTVICMLLGTIFAYMRTRKPGMLSKITEMLIGLPYALPGTVFGLMMIFAWMEPIRGWNPGIYGSTWILFIAYCTRFLFLQVRGSITALLQIDPAVEEAARVAGSNLFYKWKSILVPLMLPGVLSGAFLVFLTALTELTVSSLLWSTTSKTIGVVIFNFEQAGYTTYSTAFSSIIVFLILIGFLILRYLLNIWHRKVLKVHDS